MVTATRGSKGATVFDGERFYRQLPDYVTPVDTMGAGDSFATAMLITILKKLETQPEGSWKNSETSGGIESGSCIFSRNLLEEWCLWRRCAGTEV